MKTLSFAGHVTVAVAIEKNGDIASELDVVAIGLPLETAAGDDFEDLAFDAALGALESIPVRKRRDPDTVREALRRAVRAAVRNEWGKKPITTVIVNMVS